MLMPEARVLRGGSGARDPPSFDHKPRVKADEVGSFLFHPSTPFDNPGNPHREKPIYREAIRRGTIALRFTLYEQSNLGNASYVDGIQWKIKRDWSARSGNFPYFIKLPAR